MWNVLTWYDVGLRGRDHANVGGTMGAMFSIVGMIGVVGMMQGYVSEIMLMLEVQWGYV